MPTFTDKGSTVDIKFHDVTQVIKPIVSANMKEFFVDVFVEVAKEKAPPPPKNTAAGELYKSTGNNRASIGSHSDGGMRWTIATHSNYGGYLEFGTKRMKARPYFLPAAEEAKANMANTSERDWQP